jgi:acyl dehydratase
VAKLLFNSCQKLQFLDSIIMLYFEDLEIGQRFELGKYQVTKEEIIRFAKEFDPQPMACGMSLICH